MNASEGEEERGSKTAGEGASGAGVRRLTIVGNRLDSKDLFFGTRSIIIVHGSEAYQLRLTAQNKLILTK
jgi:hemin uptake protein HemP